MDDHLRVAQGVLEAVLVAVRPFGRKRVERAAACAGDDVVDAVDEIALVGMDVTGKDGRNAFIGDHRPPFFTQVDVAAGIAPF